MTSSSLNGLEDVFWVAIAQRMFKKAVQQRCSEVGPLWRAFQHSVGGIEGDVRKKWPEKGLWLRTRACVGDNDVEV